MASLAGIDPYTTPTLQPPSGHQPNFIDPPSSQNSLVAIGVLCLTLALVFVSARTFVKTYIIKKIQIEDYALILAGLAFAAFLGVAIAAGNAGQGRHAWDVSIPEAKRVVVFQSIYEILYGPVIFPAKLCVLMQMLRIFHGTRKDSVYWAILIAIWSNFVFYVTMTLCLMAACVPRAKLSNPALPGRCINNYASILATSTINIASDFSVLLLPVFAVWKLKVALKRKMIISAVFGMGLVACISSIIRLIYTVRLTRAKDKTWAAEAVCMWAFAECTTIILAAAFPTIPRLVQWLRGYKESPCYVQPYQKPSKPSYVATSNVSDDVEAGEPWRRANLATAKGDSYIPLEEDIGRVGTGYKAEAKQEIVGKGLSVQPNSGWNAREMGEGVLKTVRVETSYSP